MPSKGGSRTADRVPGATSPIAAIVGAALGRTAGVASALGSGLAVPFVELDEEPAADTPEWAEMYAQASAANRRERERIESEQLQSQRMWE